MNADKIIAAIKDALGHPSSGAIADSMPTIEKAVRGACDPSGGVSDARKEIRVTKSEETRDA